MAKQDLLEFKGKVIDLLPNLEWQGAMVGVRIAFAPRNEAETLTRFQERHAQAQEAVAGLEQPEGEEPYVAPP